jgi:transcriptional regulator with XRE-family HTH domain
MEMLQLGSRIRRRRESLNIQMNDLASAIGVTPSLISQIERSKAYPSILTLKKIANALRTTVGELIGESESLSAHPQVSIRERKFVKSNKTGTRVFLLSHHDPMKIMDPFLVEFKTGGTSQGIMTPVHPRQEFCLILNGEFNAIIGEERFELKEGDSFYFISDKEHLFVNTSDSTAELLWVVNHGKTP